MPHQGRGFGRPGHIAGDTCHSTVSTLQSRPATAESPQLYPTLPKERVVAFSHSHKAGVLGALEDTVQASQDVDVRAVCRKVRPVRLWFRALLAAHWATRMTCAERVLMVAPLKHATTWPRVRQHRSPVASERTFVCRMSWSVKCRIRHPGLRCFPTRSFRVQTIVTGRKRAYTRIIEQYWKRRSRSSMDAMRCTHAPAVPSANRMFTSMMHRRALLAAERLCRALPLEAARAGGIALTRGATAPWVWLRPCRAAL
jgi:hypothetical protein